DALAISVALLQLVDEVQRGVIRPVQVVELDDVWQAPLHADAPQSLRGSIEAAIANLPRVVADVLDVRAVAVVEPDELAQQMRVVLGFVFALIAGEQGHYGVFELALGLLHAVAVQDLETPRK